MKLSAVEARYDVIVIGGGPAGIGATLVLAEHSLRVLLVERAPELGGVPAKYHPKTRGIPTFIDWTRGRIEYGRSFIGRLLARLSRTNAEVRLKTQVIEIDTAHKVLTLVSPQGMECVSAHAVIFACGGREMTRAERGWLEGTRPARVFFTAQLLDLLEKHDLLPMKNPVVLGSDLIALSAAAKLESRGSATPLMIDSGSRKSRLLECFYFRRWSAPEWQSAGLDAAIVGEGAAAGVIAQGVKSVCDGIVICGDLVPNTELLIEAGIEVALPARAPVIAEGGCQLSAAGYFAAGNILGGFHGAQWCYFQGKKAAREVRRFLEQSSVEMSGII